MAKELDMLNKSLQENLDLTAYSQVGHTHKYAGSSTAGGAATSATKLATARKINGTGFNGTGDITTANWGTARTITIGNSGKSVNGSGNVGWTLAEIGAAASGHTHNVLKYVDTRDANTAPKDYNIAGIQPEFKSTSTIGLPSDTGNYAGTLTYQQWSDVTNWSGGKTTQFATVNDGRMYYRKGDGSGWGSWYQFYTTQNKPTPSDIGAAAETHGTHVTYATATPKANGTAAVGTSSKVAREDHVHPLQTTISGAAGSAGKWTTARTLTIGNAGKSVDGSANVTWTLAEIGALPLSGGTMTGAITTPNNAQGIKVGNDAVICDRNIANHIVIEGATATSGGITFGSGKDTNIYRGGANLLKTDDTFNAVKGFQWNGESLDTRYAKASHGSHISFSTATPKVAGTAAVGSDSGAARGDHVHPAQTSVSGNAGTATKLQTARNINGTAFDGTANITTAQWGNARNIYIADSNGTNTGAAVSVNGSANATLKLPATIKATLSGNASTATKLAAARTINGTNFDGSANITTANWGTSRKINQISVNGSADVKIPLDYYTCNIGASNSKPYHHILTTGQCTGSFTDKAITIVITQHYNGGGLGIARAVLRTNDTANGATATGELKWLVRLGFNENQLCYNLRNTVKDAYMDVFFKCNGTYGSATWYVLTEGTRGSHNSQWTKQSTHHDNGTHVYDETGMKAIRTYTSTLVAAEDAGFAERSNNAYYADDAGTATKWKTARTLTLNGAVTGSVSIDGSGNATLSTTVNHTHNYAGSSSAGGAATSANKVNSSLKVRLNNGTTEGTNQFTFDGSAAKTVNITPNAIGAAASSHGTHVTYSTSAPLVAGTAAVGSANNVARGDHVHPAQTSVSGNAGTATKLQTGRKITIGNKSNTFDGSANISYTLTDIGAAATSHTHTTINGVYTSNGGAQPPSYVGNGTVRFNMMNKFKGLNGLPTYADCILMDTYTGSDVPWVTGFGILKQSGDPRAFIAVGAKGNTTTWAKETELLTVANYKTHVTPSNIGAAASSHGTHVDFATATPKAHGTAAIGTSAKVAREDHVHPLQTSVATLTTARTLTIGNTGKTFNGGANVSWSLSEIGAASDVQMGVNKILFERFSRGSITGNSPVTESDLIGKTLLDSTLIDNFGAYGVGDAYLGRLTTHLYFSAATEWTTTAFSDDGSTIYLNEQVIATLETCIETSVTFNFVKGWNKIVWIFHENAGGDTTTFNPSIKTVSNLTYMNAYPVAFPEKVHQSYKSDTAITANTLSTARTLTIGNTGKTFNGSANVSWTLAEIGAAASSHSHTSINYQDTRAVNTAAKDVPNGLSIHLKSNGSDGISDGGSYHPVLMMKPWGDKSGWPVGQLAVTQNNNLYFRVSSGADDSAWNAWKKVSLDGHTHSAGGTVTAVNSNLSSVTINSYDSILSGINTNIGKL